MNSSAKFSLSLLAAGALGAVAFACSVGTSTIDDTDGGSNTSSSGSTTSSGGADAATDAPVAASCTALTYANAIDSQECEACLETSCCAETAACWNQANDGASIGCESYEQALICCDGVAADPATDCGADYVAPATPEAIKECKTGAKGVTVAGLADKYDTYLACRYNSCAAACNTQTAVGPDGGAP